MFCKKKEQEVKKREEEVLKQEKDIAKEKELLEREKKDIERRSDTHEKEMGKLTEHTKKELDNLREIQSESSKQLSEKYISNTKETMEKVKSDHIALMQKEKQRFSQETEREYANLTQEKKELDKEKTKCRQKINEAENTKNDAENLQKSLQEKDKQNEQSLAERNKNLETHFTELKEKNTTEYEELKTQNTNSYEELKQVIQEKFKEDRKELEETYEDTIKSERDQNVSLGKDINELSKQVNDYKYIEDRFNGEPSKLLEELQRLQSEKENSENLLTQYSQELSHYQQHGSVEEFQAKKQRYENELERFAKLTEDLTEAQAKANAFDAMQEAFDAMQEAFDVVSENGKTLKEELETKNKTLSEYKARNEDLEEKLSEKRISREDRVKAIAMPWVKLEKENNKPDNGNTDETESHDEPIDSNTSETLETQNNNKKNSKANVTKIVNPKKQPKTEQEFLNKIKTSIKEQGYEFEDRLIDAFHTALKCNDISIITILAGVSGTGKSTLGSLYAYYGGFIFHSISVEPNWDSSADLLGYYDSIENRYNAKPTLQILYQSQSDDKETSTKDYLHIILLDEMNLAHIELYFNQFLSKLEEKRGKSDDTTLDIDLGAGEEKMPITLGDNVFWLGTMNQDETVKSLSAKVIDRGSKLYFPSPENFADSIKTQNKEKEAVLLEKKTWDSWKFSAKTFNIKEFEKLKSDIKKKFEGIHQELIKLNRSMGHRGWQTIEKYISNHPKVIEIIVSLQKLKENQEAQKEEEVKRNEENNKKKEELEKELKMEINNAFEEILAMKIFPKLEGVDTSDENQALLESLKAKLPEGIQEDFEKSIKNPNELFMQTSSEFLKNIKESEK